MKNLDKERSKCFGHLLAMAAVLFAASCQSVPRDETVMQTREVTHHNWWNYYERGVEYLREGKHQHARQDFERAIGIRSGAKFGFPEDHWRVRTYGMHFIENYFPHRELGICLIGEGRVDEAIQHLEKSLQQQPTGRAKHYMNVARAKMLAGKVLSPPTITLDNSSQPGLTALRERVLAGHASAPGFIHSIRINRQPVFSELADETMSFRKSIKLNPGRNQITIQATDLHGTATEKTVEWQADWQPPEFTVKQVRKQGNAYTVDAICTDETGLADVTIDGLSRYPVASPVGNRALAMTITVPADRTITVATKDTAGNNFETLLSFDAFERIARNGKTVDLAMDGVSDVPFDTQLAVADGTQQSLDRLRPSLDLGGAMKATEVFRDEFFLNGVVRDGGGLASLTVCGEELLSDATKGSVGAHFSRRLPLDLGTNHFDVAAMDLAGNRTTKQIVVLRREPEYLDESCRLSLGIPPVTSQAENVAARQIKLIMENELLCDPIRFHILERDEGWDYILREQKLSLSDLADPRVAIEIRKMLPAEMLLLAKVITESSGKTIYAKLVETGNGQAVLSTDVYSSSEDDLEYQVAGLVLKIEQRFPVVTGKIVQVSGGRVTLDVGSAHGVVPATRFVVVKPRASSDSMESGIVQRVDGQYVQLNVRRVTKDACQAEIIPRHALAAVVEGDHVYAR